MGWDIWWHIKIGNEVLYQGGWPEQDTYTYTVPDDDFVIHSWLADCMFAAIYEVMGENGLLALRLIVLVIAMGLFLWYGKNTARLWPMGILMLILFSTSVHERFVRPYIFPPLLTVLLFGASKVDRDVWRIFLKFSLIVLWANLHPSYLFGCYVAIATEFCIRDKINGTAEIIACNLFVIACMLHPNGLEAFIYPFKAMQFPTEDWELVWNRLHEGKMRLWQILCLVCAICVCVYSAILWITKYRNKHNAIAVLSALGCLVLSLTAIRFVWISVVAICFCCAVIVNEAEWFEKRKLAVNWILIVLSVLLGCMKTDFTDLKKSVPGRAISFMRDCEFKGNAFVYLSWAGKIIYQLGDDVKVFIDTRIEPFVGGVYQGYRAVLSESRFSDAILLNTDIIVMPNIGFRPSQLELGTEWVVVWNSVKETIYMRKDRNDEQLKRIAKYYESKGIQFDQEKGISTLDALFENRKWVVENQFENRVDAAEIIKAKAILSTDSALSKEKRNSLYGILCKELLNNRLYFDAERCIQEAFDSGCDSAELRLLMAKSCIAIGKDEIAFEMFKKANLANGDDVKVLSEWYKFAEMKFKAKEKIDKLEQELFDKKILVGDRDFLNSRI